MTVLAVFMLLMFSGSVLASGESIAVSCRPNDVACVKKSTEQFMEQTHKGIPALNIVSVDPLVIPSLDIVFDSDGVTYKNKNLTVTGIKNQQLTDFKMDTAAKSVMLTMKADLDMVSDVTAIFPKTSTSITGDYKLKATVLSTVTYNYELKTDDKGVEHFYIGPETVTCKVIGTPKLELNPQLAEAHANDPFVKTLSEEKLIELRKRSACKVTQKSYTYVVNNVRQAAKAVPSSTFFTNIH